ncbi:SH3 and cysteine-rich domain-containing protein 2-like isoform X3 [Nerophis ophidion]|uniref:SH3 and cysteine-rich domain-containing protein 2-like isoform X3 n=1 Tax=Nerophis ophidion TaxID=159077 RepID=UPI002ADF09B0|nr:SH3 and cysteine-rich domain-containing protein 2-like isoform X3 [Nerophis ophidion]
MTEINEKENEPQHHDLQRPRATVPSQPESKLQRLKRSLSFKSVMRSKSVDNFFQRSNGDARPPCTLIIPPAPPPSPPPCSESPLAYERSPFLSPSASPIPSLSESLHSPSICPSLSLSSKGLPKSTGQPATPPKTHCFQEHVFRRPTNCERCKHSIQEADNVNLDPVYEALRYGTSLAHMSRSSFGSITESPCHEAEKLQDKLENQPIAEEEPIPGMLTPPESEKADSEERVSLKTPKHVEIHSIHTYVALYKFLPQEKNDLELQPGDRVKVTDDSNEDWWKGKSQNKVGYFPANFVQRVRPGERVWKVTAGFHGNRDKGQMTVKEAQICFGKNEDIDGFLRLSSGKKRGLVPVNILLEI